MSAYEEKQKSKDPGNVKNAVMYYFLGNGLKRLIPLQNKFEKEYSFLKIDEEKQTNNSFLITNIQMNLSLIL